ncbi:MAG TPA: hypothetical protein PLJ35_14850 [Anaerolineae bacterium]|nr:hypothetical protein [Anaerolineae bacterium]HPL26882.1 hypothetical protein [Anaerolineae bacterium]
MNPDFRRCAHHGCSRWAMHDHRGCVVHAGSTDVRPAPRLGRRLADLPTEPLGPIDLVRLELDSLRRYHRLRAGYRRPDAAALAYLRALAATARELAPGGEDGAAAARAEIDAFLDTIAERVLERAAQEAAEEARQAVHPAPLAPGERLQL